MSLVHDWVGLGMGVEAPVGGSEHGSKSINPQDMLFFSCAMRS